MGSWYVVRSDAVVWSGLAELRKSCSLVSGATVVHVIYARCLQGTDVLESVPAQGRFSPDKSSFLERQVAFGLALLGKRGLLSNQ